MSFKTVKDKIIRLRETDIILDNAVAELYGVQTKEINQAVKNNPKKFPDGYVFELNKEELSALRSKKMTAISPMSRTMPKAFTEKGLYMLATILKGDKAAESNPSPSGDAWFDDKENIRMVKHGISQLENGEGRIYKAEEIKAFLGV